MTLLRIALRSHTAGFITATAMGVLFGLGNAAGYPQIAGTDPAERAIFAQQMEILGRQFTYLLPAPLQLDTLAGFLHWRMFGTLAIVYAFWALMAASGLRGDEERGLVETWLAAGVRRLRYLATRVGAFAIAATVSVALTVALTYLGAVAAGEALAGGGMALQGVALALLAMCCFAIALAGAQLSTTQRGAAGASGAFIAALFLVNSASRSGGLEQVAWLSPFWAYDRNTPMLLGGGLDPAALAGLALASTALVGLAALAFAARDIGAPLFRWAPRLGTPRARPSRDPLLRLPVLAILDQQRAWILGWAVGLAALAAFFISLTRLMVDALLEVPQMRVYFERLGTAGYDTFVAVIWGSTALLLLSLYAIGSVSDWVADDAEGRLEAMLAHPVSRARVVMERAAALAGAMALVLAASTVVSMVVAARSGIDIAQDRFALGSALMLAVPFALGGVGAALVATRPRAAVPVLAVVAIVGYFTQLFTPLLDWPEWVARTSIYELYGRPIADEVDWVGIAILLAMGLGGTAAGVVLMRRRDVGR